MLFTELGPLVAFARLRSQRMAYDGTVCPRNLKLMRSCAHLYRVDLRTSAALIFTRDIGHHENGWWKNPSYEQCEHLSISFKVNPTDEPVPYMPKVAETIARAFFGDDVRKVWVEPPVTPEGISNGVHHHRLFCDQMWNAILPHGEVYSRKDTPAGWKSFSEIYGWSPAKENAPFLLDASQ
jgi:hypothetical protein